MKFRNGLIIIISSVAWVLSLWLVTHRLSYPDVPVESMVVDTVYVGPMSEHVELMESWALAEAEKACIFIDSIAVLNAALDPDIFAMLRHVENMDSAYYGLSALSHQMADSIETHKRYIEAMRRQYLDPCAGMVSIAAVDRMVVSKMNNSLLSLQAVWLPIRFEHTDEPFIRCHERYGKISRCDTTWQRLKEGSQ